MKNTDNWDDIYTGETKVALDAYEGYPDIQAEIVAEARAGIIEFAGATATQATIELPAK